MTEREAQRKAAAHPGPEEAELVEDAPERADDDAPPRPASPPAELIGAPSPAPELRPSDEDLPVVARLVVEIRSDGSRTIARGGLEDLHQGHRVAIEARGDSPLALALALAKSIGTMTSGLAASLAGKKKEEAERPRLLSRQTARAALRGLLDRRRK